MGILGSVVVYSCSGTVRNNVGKYSCPCRPKQVHMLGGFSTSKQVCVRT